MRPYKYLSLNGKDQIRLLHLLPCSASTEICIKIETVTLSADQFPQYEAQSYAWGSANYKKWRKTRLEERTNVPEMERDGEEATEASISENITSKSEASSTNTAAELRTSPAVRYPYNRLMSSICTEMRSKSSYV